MYREIFDGIRSYDFFNTFGFYVAILCSVFFVKARTKTLSIYASCVSAGLEYKNKKSSKIFNYFAAIIEGAFMAFAAVEATSFNGLFGDIVGTGANYFGALFMFAPILILASLLFFENPLKNMDIAIMTVPICLFFVKIACFCQGCCYGIPWEHGMYNHHPKHSGYQVPVQLIEALWALLIFVFLLWYRKRAKTGTLLPIYMIIYSATRFCSEFLRREEAVFWIFKTYHILCIVGIILGILFLIFVRKYGDRISNWFREKRILIIKSLLMLTVKISGIIKIYKKPSR